MTAEGARAAADLLASFMGQRIAGGCDDCNAEQEVEQLEPALFVLHVFHDEGCPFLAAREGGR